jgi:hypothetical protein
MRFTALLATLLVGLFLAPSALQAQHNPYLDRKKKNKPSVRQSREDARHLKQQKKLAKKQMRKSRKAIGRSNRRKAKGRG